MALDFITGYVLGAYQAGRAAGAKAAPPNFTPGPATNVYDLNDRIDRLTLVVEAMWTMMEESGISPDELIDRINELDGSDGSLDGTQTHPSTRCPGCQAVVAAGSTSCQFCGTEILEDNPFAEAEGNPFVEAEGQSLRRGLSLS